MSSKGQVTIFVMENIMIFGINKESAYNSSYKKLAVQWLNEVFCFVSSSVLADPPRRMLRNRQLLEAANRYMQPYQTGNTNYEKKRHIED